ncbi:MAG TPA: DUF4124 domain-containing protein [Geobacteraceae bacterium]|nr:DUF4124 domain-containing protein [Geobacteraceae bacterium]
MKRLPVLLLLVAATAQAEIYTWTDSRGTNHYTNSIYEIPEKYRAKAKVLNLGIVEKKDGPSSPEPPVPQQPAAPATPPVQPKEETRPAEPASSPAHRERGHAFKGGSEKRSQQDKPSAD